MGQKQCMLPAGTTVGYKFTQDHALLIQWVLSTPLNTDTLLSLYRWDELAGNAGQALL